MLQILSAKTISKYKGKSLPQLLKLATTHFNKFIRYRDTDENGFGTCISSGQPLRVPSNNAHAGHYYSGGHYPILRFNEKNVHLQGLSDNFYKSANLIEYRKRLINKIGKGEIEKLDLLADASKRSHFKWDRISLIEIIETYKEKNKTFNKNF